LADQRDHQIVHFVQPARSWSPDRGAYSPTSGKWVRSAGVSWSLVGPRRALYPATGKSRCAYDRMRSMPVPPACDR
jgi:hypothetical protein